MSRFTTTVTSARRAEEVFDLLADMRNAASWDPGDATLVSAGPDGGVGPGATFDVTLRLAGRPRHVTYRVADYDRPRRVVLEADDPAFRSVDTVTVEPLEGGGARATYDAVLEPAGLLRLASPLMAAAFGRIARRAAAGLSQVLAG
jgi:uncharacterized protein YndB with AHSA1/START domain